jgi:hypothetical protein
MSTTTEPPSKKAKIMKSMYITDSRACDGEYFGTSYYVYTFDKSMVPLRAWEALMVLEEKGKFYFPNVGDCGYHSLVDNVKDRQIQDEHLQEFFNLAMEDIHSWPGKESTREESMKQLGNCSWVVNLVEE